MAAATAAAAAASVSTDAAHVAGAAEVAGAPLQPLTPAMVSVPEHVTPCVTALMLSVQPLRPVAVAVEPSRKVTAMAVSMLAVFRLVPV